MKKTILVVEDDESILENLVEFLESEGYHALKAFNGKQALELLEKTDDPPALIILDLMMPVMDGIEFRRRQQTLPRFSSIPVLLISADHQIDLKKAKLAVTRSLKKPLDIDLLSATIKEIVA